MTLGAPRGTDACIKDSGWTTASVFIEFLSHFVSTVQPSDIIKKLILISLYEIPEFLGIVYALSFILWNMTAVIQATDNYI